MDAAMPFRLEWMVEQYNINHGKNQELLQKVASLREYSLFMGKYEEYRKKFPQKQALYQAIQDCIAENVMAEYLKEKEVFDMFALKWDAEIARRVWRKEAQEEGMVQGRELGLEEGRVQGLEQGRELGLKERQRATALKMLMHQEPLEKILDYSELPEEKIREIARQNHMDYLD